MKSLKVLFVTLMALFLSSAYSAQVKVESVVFDFGGVLCNYQRKEATEYLSNTLNVEPSQVREGFAAYRSKHGSSFSEENLWKVMGDVLKVKLPIEMAKMFRDFLAERMDIHPEMKALVKDLKSKGYGVYMLSNQNFIHYRVLKEKAIFDLFDDSVVSHIVKVSKPDEKIYSIFIDQTKQDPSKCLFIDDKQENLDAAKKLGFQTLLFDIHKTTIDSFKESLNILLKN